MQPLIPKVVLIAYKGFFVLVNSIDAFWVGCDFRVLDAYMYLLTILVAALFSAVALSATLSCVNYFAFSHGADLQAGRHVVWLSPWS